MASTWAYDRDYGNLLEYENSYLRRTGGVRHCSLNNHSISGAIQKMQTKLQQQAVHINREPLICDIKSLLPSISLELVSNTIQEPLWDYLVRNYHYLGYRKLLGHRLKYLAFVNKRPIAAFSWSAPALKIRYRDKFIGWSDEQRKRHLKRIANNTRFLIPDWVQIPHLASHLLSKCIQRLNTDWQKHFNYRLWCLETFAENPARPIIVNPVSLSVTHRKKATAC
jgi:hypothetical protein